MVKKSLFFCAGLLLGSCSALPPDSEIVPYYQAATDKPYDDVLAELQSAIAEHNFRITAHSRVGKVIRDRGDKDFPEFDTIQFCNLTLAKTLLDMSPHAIGHMPCNVVTYQFNGKTIIKTHLLPEDSDNPDMNRFAKQMNEQIKQIVDFAAEQ